MTTLKPTHPVTVTLGFLLAIGCSSSRVEVATETGGVTGSGGTGCCTTPPTCDSGDLAWDPNGTSTQVVSPGTRYYMRSSCCKSIYCFDSHTGTGGASSGLSTTDPYMPAGGTPWETGGNMGNPTGGAPWATGGTPPWMTTPTGGSPSIEASGGARAYIGYEYPNPHCTLGADQTCNDPPWVSALWGQCQAEGYCNCNDGYYPSPSTGKCTTKDQTVCYSPTQNIDKAYVDRAFGCNCVSTTDKPWCGIDSEGLRVYLTCTSTNKWQSGDTSSCN